MKITIRRLSIRALLALAAALLLQQPLSLIVRADATHHNLASSDSQQDWANTGLITANDDWSGVPSIIGYRGDDLTSTNDVDPQTVLAESTVVDVNANQANPNTFATGGVTEFHITDPVVALGGSGTADAPHIVIHLNITNRQNVRVRYNLRDIDGSADNATQQVALQYRVGATGNFTNVPAGYVSDATTGPSLATLVTPIDVTLPAAANNQAQVQVRVITTNASGNDEWVGIDDIRITSDPFGGSDSAPTVASTTPADGATRAPVDANVRISFSEDVTVTTSSFEFTCGGAAKPFALNGSGSQYTLDPTTDFTGGQSCTVTVIAANVQDNDADDPPNTMESNFTFSFTPQILRIGEVQGAVGDAADGATFASPLAGQRVTVQGVVYEKTLARSVSGGTVSLQHSFFIQNTTATADSDPMTSDGIFVFIGGPTTVPGPSGPYTPQVGDEIVISGTVTEFFNLTELTGTTVNQVVDSGVALDAEVPAFEADPPESDPAVVARYWERREGMRARVPTGSIVTGPTIVFSGSLDGEIRVADPTTTIAQRSNEYARRAFRDPHPLDNVPDQLFDDANAYRILLGSLGIKATAGDATATIAPTARTLDTLGSPLVGGVYYSFGKYSVQPTQQPDLTRGPDPSLNAPPQAPNREREFSIASFNVENLYDFRDDPTDGCDFADDEGCPGVAPPFDYVPASQNEYNTRLGQIATQIRQDLHSPDILLIQETEDQDICIVRGGSLACDGSDGKPDTLQELALEIARQGGPTYDTGYDRDSADDRGIVQGYLFRTDRVQLLPPQASDPVLGSSPTVTYDGAPVPYNADVQNPKSLNARLPDDITTSDVDRNGNQPAGERTNVFTRAPLVALFRITRAGDDSVDLYLSNNHFSSGPDRRVAQRTEQAAFNAAIVAAIQGASPRARAVVGGDLNVYPRPDDPFPPPNTTDQLAPLYDRGLFNLWERVVAEVPTAAYSYVFDHQAQTLDQLFVTPILRDELVQARYAHINSDWPIDLLTDGPRGVSDHDPQAARFSFTSAAPTVTISAGSATFTEGGPPVAVDPNLTVADPDSANLVGATVQITSGFVAGQDVLGFINQAGITGSYNATTGVLTLTGTATVAQYQTALRSVTYANSSGNPSTATRAVTFQVSDGVADSNTSTRSVAVTAVDDPSSPPGAANTPPTISDIPNLTINENQTAGPISFTVSDDQTPAADLTVTASSSNPTLVPSANITLGGSGITRTITITPAANQSGTATVTVTVTDPQGATATDTFTLNVSNLGGPTPRNTPPTISDIPDQRTFVAVPIGPIRFTIGDAETPAGELVVRATSSNRDLVPNSSIVLGGSGANRTITITPRPGQPGRALIVVTVSDGVNTVGEVFRVFVGNTDTVGLYDPATNTFHLHLSNTENAIVRRFSFLAHLATSGWLPVTGDWNGNGETTIGLYDPDTNTFYLRDSNDDGPPSRTFVYRPNLGPDRPPEAYKRLLPLAGKWRGDARTSVGLYDPASGWFYLRDTTEPRSGDTRFRFRPNGTNEQAVPVAGDWDGNGIWTVGLYDLVGQRFFLRATNGRGSRFDRVALDERGPGRQRPVVGDWDGDGTTTVGVYDPDVQARTFHLTNADDLRGANNTAVAEAELTFQAETTAGGLIPLAGDWNGP